MFVKKSEVKVKPFYLDDFTQDKETRGSMKKVTKKELRKIANDLGLAYEDSDIIFTKKLMTAFLERLQKKII